MMVAPRGARPAWCARLLLSGCFACACFVCTSVACSDAPALVTYCDVQPIIEARCVRCHGDPTEHSAPFSLTSYVATQQTYFDAPIYERMAVAVRADSMPPVTLDVTPPVVDVTSAEEAQIVDWADAGAPAGDCQ
jgi:uncharacterized membrane protein